MALIGIAPLTMVRTQAGRSEYVYAGQLAPADIHPDDLDRLVDEGFLQEVDEPEIPDEVVVPDDPATGTAGAGVTVERPKTIAAKPAWVDYRVAQELMTREQADAITLAQLKDDEFMASFPRRAREVDQVAAAEQAAADAAVREAEQQGTPAGNPGQPDSAT